MVCVKMQLQQSVALITGGCQGLGRAFARELLKRGAKVSVIDINEDAGKKFITECETEFKKDQVHFIRCDVTDSTQFEGSSKSFYIYSIGAVMDGTYLGIKYMGTTNGGNGGLIINIGSVAGLNPIVNFGSYNASKHGVVGFSKSFEHLYAKEKIKVKCLCPCFVQTALVERGLAEVPKLQEVIDVVGMVSIEEVARGFMHLVTDDNEGGTLLTVTPKGLAYVKQVLEEQFINGPSSTS